MVDERDPEQGGEEPQRGIPLEAGSWHSKSSCGLPGYVGTTSLRASASSTRIHCGAGRYSSCES